MEVIGIGFLSVSCLILLKLINDMDKKINKLEKMYLFTNQALVDRVKKLEKGEKNMSSFEDDLNDLIKNLKIVKRTMPNKYEGEFKRAMFELPADLRGYIEKKVNEDE